MLHVLDGDAVRPAFEAAGIPGDVVVWGEACVEGPWPRALRGVEATVARVREAAEAGEEVVAWFDADLFCRLNAACLASLVPDARFTNALGSHVRPGEMRGLFDRRVPWEPGLAQVWRAYVSPDPRGLAALAGEHPWLRLHLGRFPSARNGLDIVEERILWQLRKDGPSPIRGSTVRMRVGDLAPDRYGLTFEEVEQRAREMGPLVDWVPAGPHEHRSDATHVAAITPLGLAVLDGERDRCEVAPLDRWVGGVHLVGPRPEWRWDGVTLLRAPA